MNWVMFFNFLFLTLTVLLASKMASPKPTRTQLLDTDIEELLRNCLCITYTPEDKTTTGLTCKVISDLYHENYEEVLEGVLKLPQQPELDEFVAVFHADGETLLNETLPHRIQTAQGVQTLTIEENEVVYTRTCTRLKNIEASNTPLFKVLWENIYACLITGKPKDVTMVWEPNPIYVRTSTPHPNPTDKLVQGLLRNVGDLPSGTIRKMFDVLSLEANRRGEVVPPNPFPIPTPFLHPPHDTAIPKPDAIIPPEHPPVHPPTEPQPHINFDPNVIGETIAKANESLIETLANHGLLRTQVPKICQFSGDNMKGDASFEQWEYEVEILRPTHTASAIREAITKSLKGSAAEALRALGINATLESILSSLRGKYGIAASYDTLMTNLYTFTQDTEESVPQFATKIETLLSSIKWKFPGQISPDVETKILRDRLFYGIRKEIRDSIRFRFSDPSISYSQLLQFARESELESQFSTSGIDPSKEKKGKAKSSAVMTNAPNSTVGSDLAKLSEVADKVQKETEKAQTLLKELTEAMSRNNNSGNRGRGNGHRGRGNGFRGRGRGNGFGRGGNQAQGNQNPNQNQSQNAQGRNQYQRRTPRCFHCIQNGSDQTDHWPNQCELLKSILQDWHVSQNSNGHQSQTQNLNI